MCVDWNGVESARDWVGADVVVNVSGTSVGAAAKLFVKEVNAEKELVTCTDEWSNQELAAEDTSNPLVSLQRTDR